MLFRATGTDPNADSRNRMIQHTARAPQYRHSCYSARLPQFNQVPSGFLLPLYWFCVLFAIFLDMPSAHNISSCLFVHHILLYLESTSEYYRSQTERPGDVSRSVRVSATGLMSLGSVLRRSSGKYHSGEFHGTKLILLLEYTRNPRSCPSE